MLDIYPCDYIPLPSWIEELLLIDDLRIGLLNLAISDYKWRMYSSASKSFAERSPI
jgi:hypothetical protein